MARVKNRLLLWLLRWLGMDEKPDWIVNSLGELGVRVHGRCFFLYKGGSLEYEGRVNLPDGQPMQYRLVGKREFGECVYPRSVMKSGVMPERYDADLVWDPRLSDGTKDDPDFQWQTIPKRKDAC